VRDAFTIGRYVVYKVLGGWLLALLVLGMVSLLLALFQSGPEELDELLRTCRRHGLTVTYVFSMLAVLIAGSTELPRELQTGTILLLMAKPLRREHIVVGKTLGIMGVGAVCVLLQTAVGSVILLVRGLPPDPAYGHDVFAILAKVTIMAAAVVMFSTAVAEIPTLFLASLYWVTAEMAHILDQLLRLEGLGPLLSFVFLLLYYMVPNLHHFEAGAEAAPALPTFLLSIFYGVFYCALLTWVGICFFRRREIAGG
jgi:hypothetical protein